MEFPQELIDLVNNSTAFLCHVHASPDADSIGSCLALKQAFESQGKVVDLFCEDSIPDFANFLPGVDEIKNISLKEALATSPAEVYLSLDTAKWPLATHSDQIPNIGIPIINLDHHLDNSIKGKYNAVFPQASSAAEVIYQLLLKLNYSITAEVATSLLFGLMGDTHAFNNYNSSATVLRLGADLIDLGADYIHCLVGTTRSLPFDFVKTWEMLIHHLTRSEDGSYVYVAIDNETWRSGNGGSVALFANELICKITNTAFGAVIIEKQPGVTTASLRSRDPEFDVAAVASSLGGGGHKHSASFRLNKPLGQTLLDFKNAVAKLSVK